MKSYIAPLRFSFSYCAGLLLGLPIAFPFVPFYLVGFAVFSLMCVMFFRRGHRVDLRTIVLILAAMIASVLSNIVSINSSPIQTSRILFTTIYYVFFYFGCLVPDHKALLRGFVTTCNFFSIYVLVVALVVRPWSAGMLMFSVPESRLWGLHLFPDWPNYFAFMLSLGFVFNTLVFKRPFFALMTLVAALLTTSRSPLLALAFVGVFGVSSLKNRFSKYILVAMFLVGIVGFGVWVPPNLSNGSDFMSRLFIFSDRASIYSYSLKLIMQSPLFGMGSVLMDESIGHTGFASFHNSYLDILVRHGLVGFTFFILLLWPLKPCKNAQNSAYWALICLFLMGSLFQNFFKHPHFIMIYSVILCSRGYFIEGSHE